MRDTINGIINKVLDGEEITFEESISLINIDNKDKENIELLFEGANRIRKRFSGNKVDLCSIMNTKSGKCSEDCKFCAQSSHYDTGVKEYELLNYDKILERAKEMEKENVHRFSLVTSGKGITDEEFERVIEIYKRLRKDTNLNLCASHGVISYEQAVELKKAGVTMYHHNVECSSNHYGKICTTHTYEERVATINNLKKAGLEICCGGILGLGELKQDRVKMAFEIKELGIKSVPVNILNPSKGTPLENEKLLSPMEILKTMAVYRYIIPNGFIRYAGGRQALENMQKVGLRSGVNAALVGNYLTSIGSNIDEDKDMIRKQGFNL